jgi:hypothetical protein
MITMKSFLKSPFPGQLGLDVTFFFADPSGPPSGPPSQYGLTLLVPPLSLHLASSTPYLALLHLFNSSYRYTQPHLWILS